MKQFKKKLIYFSISLILIFNVDVAFAQKVKVISCYGPVNQDIAYNQIKTDMMKVKVERSKEHNDLLNTRYYLSKKTSTDVFLSGGKPIPLGPTAKLQGTNWANLDKLSPEEIKSKGIFSYKPLPFANHVKAASYQFSQRKFDTNQYLI